jgi:hypothetical protein
MSRNIGPCKKKASWYMTQNISSHRNYKKIYIYTCINIWVENIGHRRNYKQII